MIGGYKQLTHRSVVTLTFLPSLLQPRAIPLSHTSSFSSLDLAATGEGEAEIAMLPLHNRTSAHTASRPPPGFVTKLAGALAKEFEYLLKWELPMNTLVEFNEVGKCICPICVPGLGPIHLNTSNSY